jgi:glycosyltransferase involved in cell wall biosynthesis
MNNVALVHDWLNQLGGAEDVLVTLHGMFPRAPIFTSVYDRARMPSAWRTWDIRSSWMDRLPQIHRHHQPYMPLFALTWSRYKIAPEHDMILSNKSGFCIGAHGAATTRHVCYCLTPSRFIYDFDAYAKRENIPTVALPMLRMMNALLRQWESRAAQRVTQFIAISSEIKRRIQQHYKRDSEVIYPPVDLAKFQPQTGATQSGGYFFIVSRLLPYKRIDLAIQACNELNLPLVIAGAGRDRERLQSMAGSTVKLLGRVSDDELISLLNDCRAFIFPGLEDFGIAPIQAMACGKPVIAFAGGGALDTVIDGKTGLLFAEQNVESLKNAIQKMNDVNFAPDQIRAHAENFSVARFTNQLLRVMQDASQK